MSQNYFLFLQLLKILLLEMSYNNHTNAYLPSNRQVILFINEFYLTVEIKSKMNR